MNISRNTLRTSALLYDDAEFRGDDAETEIEIIRFLTVPEKEIAQMPNVQPAVR